MRNIIIALDTNHPSQGAIDLGYYLAKLTYSKLSGIFPSYPNDEHSVFARFVDDRAPSVVLSKQKAQAVEDAINHFRQVCLQQDVHCTVQRDSEDPGTDLVTESLFADALVVDEAVSFSGRDNRVPSQFITTLLAHAKCPVIIASESFTIIEEIIFAYDGTYSSLFAMKQFTYLFPELKDRKVFVVEVTDNGAIAEPDRLRTWMRDYYTDVVYETLQGNATDRLLAMVMSKQKALLVIGAFGRNALSSFFRSSTADRITKLADNPVFVAHH